LETGAEVVTGVAEIEEVAVAETGEVAAAVETEEAAVEEGDRIFATDIPIAIGTTINILAIQQLIICYLQKDRSTGRCRRAV
jgi:hypothetical protein